MRVVIAGNFDFPAGSASAARVRQLALGLQANGARVHLMSLAPPVDNSACRSWEGGIVGRDERAQPTHSAMFDITYEKLAHAPGPGPGRRLRWLGHFYGSVRPAYRRLAARLRHEGCDLFLGYGRSAVQLWPLIKLCQRYGTPTILDVVESLEQFHGWGGRFSPLYWDAYLATRHLPRLCDGATAISRPLAAALRQQGQGRVLVLPPLEDGSPAALPTPKTSTGGAWLMLYLGALQERDAPDYLLDLLRTLRGRGVPLRTAIVGRYEASAVGRHYAAQVARDPLLRSCVQLVGALSEAELATQLAQADAFILTRRLAGPEICSFPTRLVELLRWGRPLFVSEVGDIGDYVRDGRDGVLLPPGNVTAAARRIEAVWRDPVQAQALGRAGQQRGAYCFDRTFHAARLMTMIP